MLRRRFLHQAGTGVGCSLFPLILPRSVFGAPGVPAASERIKVALIGAGGRAHDLLRECPLDIELVAIADCDLRLSDRFDQWIKENRVEVGAKTIPHYQDYRTMFEKERLDAVIVATTTHARALVCLHAMEAGLDVYAEKPLTLTIEEGKFLVRAEQKYGTVLQVGTQQRSIPLNNFGSDLVKNGAVGKIHTVLCANYIGPETRPPLPEVRPPEGMNWDLWCHQTELIPPTSDLHPGLGKWGKFRDYDGGGLSFGVTGWGAHSFDQVQRALGTDHTTPSKVWIEGDPGPMAKVCLEFEGGPTIRCEKAEGEVPGLGGIFLGEKGRIEIDRNLVVSDIPELVKDAPPPDDPSVVASVAHKHLQNWVDCMRTRSRPVASAEIGHHSSVICHQINICRELGRALEWDPVAEVFLNDDEANRLCSRPRRKGYELPVIN